MVGLGFEPIQLSFESMVLATRLLLQDSYATASSFKINSQALLQMEKEERPLWLVNSHVRLVITVSFDLHEDYLSSLGFK